MEKSSIHEVADERKNSGLSKASTYHRQTKKGNCGGEKMLNFVEGNRPEEYLFPELSLLVDSWKWYS